MATSRTERAVYRRRRIGTDILIPDLLRSATRHLPYFRGTSALLRLYRRCLTPSAAARQINDFDGDLKIRVDLTDCIGINLWHCPELYERNERDLFCAAIRPGMVALDVGANIGIYTLLAAKRGARVIAVEADPGNAECLRSNIKLNGFAVQIHSVAAADQDGPTDFYQQVSGNRGGSNLFGGGAKIEVQRRRLDSLLGNVSVDLCKIDVEGAEYATLMGMKQILSASPQMALLVEYMADHPHASELVDLLRSRFAHVVAVGAERHGPDLPHYGNLWCTP